MRITQALCPVLDLPEGTVWALYADPAGDGFGSGGFVLD